MATAVLTGCATKADGERNDKLESFNRTMFDFNYKVMDRYVLEPAAKGWRDYDADTGHKRFIQCGK